MTSGRKRPRMTAIPEKSIHQRDDQEDYIAVSNPEIGVWYLIVPRNQIYSHGEYLYMMVRSDDRYRAVKLDDNTMAVETGYGCFTGREVIRLLQS